MKKKLINIIVVVIASFFAVSVVYSYSSFSSTAKVSFSANGINSITAPQFSKLGINYGHQFSSGNYSTTTVDEDMQKLLNSGVSKIRVAMYAWNSTSAVPQQIALRAKAAGLYTLYGACACTGSAISLTTWNNFLALAPAKADWAAVNGIDAFAIGNEDEANVDGTTLTATQLRSDLKALATTIKAAHPEMKIQYVFAASDANRDAWSTLGLGDIDYIGANEYFGLDPYTAGFRAHVRSMASVFGDQAFIGEWNTANGITDFRGSEQSWADNVRTRYQIIQQYMATSTLGAYFFSYGDGQSGVPADTYGLAWTGGIRKILETVLNLNLR